MTSATTRAGELDLILHAIPAGITVLDHRGALVYANDVAAAACGFRSGSEMIAAPVDEVLARFQLWDEEGRPLSPRDLHGAPAATDQPAERVVRFRPLSPAGPDRWISIRAVPVLDREGRASRVVNVFRDVTERRRADRWQRFLGEASAAAASSMDLRVLLQEVADLAARSVADWCGIDMRQPDGSLRRVAVAGDDPDGASTLAVPLSTRGEQIGALTLATAGVLPPYGEADRAAAEQLAQRLSITIDNVRLYGEAQEALRAREDLLAIVSHDLRNPLGVVLASSALLLKSSLPPEKEERARRQVEAIQRAGNRMNRLIRDLLDFASIQGGRLAITHRPHDAAALVTEVVEALDPLAVQKSVHVSSEVREPALQVSGDHDRLIQAFSNVLGNAIKFTPEGGTIRMGAAREGDLVRFFVSDTGPGIPADELDHVFDRYFQARRKNREGIGLGLSIAKGIVDAHGGRIWVESREGDGSTFFIALPPG
jgi:PAS domain S-box-containing protein